MTTPTWKIEEHSDPSESTSGKSYTYGVASDNRVQCNCTGWGILKSNPGYRWCKHTKKLIAKHHLSVVVVGKYQFATKGPQFSGISGTAVPSAPLNVTTASQAPAPKRSAAEEIAALRARGQERERAKSDATVARELTANRVVPAPVARTITIGKRVIRTVGQDAAPVAPKATAAPTVVSAPRPAPTAEEFADAYVRPMLASPMPDLPDPSLSTTLAALKRYSATDWAMEEKFDGHRVVVAVSEHRNVKAWSRPGHGKDALVRVLSDHLIEAFSRFPEGTYDGELFVPGTVSTSVTDLNNAGKEVFVVFDVTRLCGVDVWGSTWDYRRDKLDAIFAHPSMQGPSPVKLSPRYEPDADTVKLILERGGEGAILKRRNAVYQPGVRSKNIIKIKTLEIEVMEVVGFLKGKLGPSSRIKVRNPKDGSTTTVAAMGGGKELVDAVNKNPGKFLGRRMLMEYQFRTTSTTSTTGSYRHPRFDRWENE